MQQDDLENKIEAIAHEIKNMDERKKLEELSTKMENDPEVIKLSLIFQNAQENYNFALKHFKEDSEEVKKAQKSLYEAKKNLDEHPLVKEYNAFYVASNEPLRYLELNLIYKLNSKKL